MEAKPLTKQQLEEVRVRLCDGYNDYARELVEGLLAAEQYWREAYSKLDFVWADSTGYVTCDACKETSDHIEGLTHKNDCAWVRAQ